MLCQFGSTRSHRNELAAAVSLSYQTLPDSFRQNTIVGRKKPNKPTAKRRLSDCPKESCKKRSGQESNDRNLRKTVKLLCKGKRREDNEARIRDKQTIQERAES